MTRRLRSVGGNLIEVSSPLVPVSDLPAGTVARLMRADVDADTLRMLGALGLSETARFRLCTDHEPYIVQVRSTRIGLSRATARGLFASVETTGG